MSDTIPADMRAAIDAYDGPVTVCPPRTFALDASETIPIERSIKAHWDKRRAARKSMDDRVARLFNDGKSPSQIAEAVGLAANTVQKRLNRLRAEGAVGFYDRSQVKRPFALGPTAEKVMELANGKRTIVQIAASFDPPLSRKAVDCAIRRLRRAGYSVPINYGAGKCRTR